jgi:hypothetical protein
MAYGRTTTTESITDASGILAQQHVVVGHPTASFSEFDRAILNQLVSVVKSATFCDQPYI